ncbi:MAG: hypothetical protein V1749_10325 [Candidatus Desantisbacteria bacterium]
MKLRHWQAYTSYNQNSRYYALPTVTRFDENGLWFYKNIFFSKYGNLRDTVVHLINNSPSGLTGNEIGDLVNLLPRSFLHHFREVAGIQRQKVEGVYAYYSGDPGRYKVQVQNRSMAAISAGKRLSDANAVIILAALIKQHGLGVEDIMGLPEVRKLKLSRPVISEFLDRHDLLKKTPDTGP